MRKDTWLTMISSLAVALCIALLVIYLSGCATKNEIRNGHPVASVKHEEFNQDKTSKIRWEAELYKSGKITAQWFELRVRSILEEH